MGATTLIKQHLDLTHRESDTQLNMNILGLVRTVVPQYAKDGKVKGATLTLISDGGAFSTLEFPSNVQAASNALQRLVGNKTICTQEHCPETPLSLDNNYPENAQLQGKDFLLSLVLGAY